MDSKRLTIFFFEGDIKQSKNGKLTKNKNVGTFLTWAKNKENLSKWRVLSL